MKIKEENMFSCANCPFECSNKKTVAEHEEGHKENVLCEICSKSFLTEKSLKAHKRIHTDRKPLICTYCSKGFVEMSTLNQHEREQHEEEATKHPCTDCDKSFKRKKNLEIHHKTIHEGIKRYRKPNTSKQIVLQTKEFLPEFKSEAVERVNKVGLEEASMSLMLHKATLKSWMIGEGSYSCNFCQKSFRFKSYMENHQKLHLNNNLAFAKPLKIFKEKRFSSIFKQEVIDYAKKHSFKSACVKFGLGESTVRGFLKLGTFSCHLCKRQCSYKKQLERHLLEVHKIEDDIKEEKAITKSDLKEEEDEKEVKKSTQLFRKEASEKNMFEKKLPTELVDSLEDQKVKEVCTEKNRIVDDLSDTVTKKNMKEEIHKVNKKLESVEMIENQTMDEAQETNAGRKELNKIKTDETVLWVFEEIERIENPRIDEDIQEEDKEEIESIKLSKNRTSDQSEFENSIDTKNLKKSVGSLDTKIGRTELNKMETDETVLSVLEAMEKIENHRINENIQEEDKEGSKVTNKLETDESVFSVFENISRSFTDMELDKNDENPTAEKKYSKKSQTCDQCGKMTRDMKRHMISHSTIKPFKCDVCKASFGHRFNLKKHKGTSACIPLQCSQCEKTFDNRANLASHELKHLGATMTKQEKAQLFSCGICHKVLASKGILKRHRLTHTNQDKDFQCQKCGKCYLMERDLKTHNKVAHLKIKDVSCLLCPKVFGRMSTLRAHIQTTHSKLRQFSCDQCPQQYKQKRNLQIHSSKMH